MSSRRSRRIPQKPCSGPDTPGRALPRTGRPAAGRAHDLGVRRPAAAARRRPVPAVVLGLVGGVSALARRAFDPTINAVRPISITGWVPLALVLFGIGDQPAIFITALAIFFPVYVDALSGTRYVEERMIRAARMLGATRGEVIRSVVLPAALPSIAVGLRVAAAIAWTTVVIAVILGARSGLGYVLIDSYNRFRFDYVIAAMVSLGACGFLTDRAVQLAFARPLRWVSEGAH
ncbi:ABC transporter permease [Nonomuraea fuscirosea]|uniref:ABC transporter permease n=1 Tax=Nonomuraea fuscirosea TaxID=1291556 RepID=UPI00341EBBB9